MKKLKKINTPDRVLSTIQDNISAAITELQQAPILNNQTVSMKATPDNDIRVSHKLGRSYVGFFPVSTDADVRVWVSPTLNKNPDQVLILRASSTANIMLLIF